MPKGAEKGPLKAAPRTDLSPRWVQDSGGGSSGDLLECSWGAIEASWGPLGMILELLGLLLEPMGVLLGCAHGRAHTFFGRAHALGHPCARKSVCTHKCEKCMQGKIAKTCTGKGSNALSENRIIAHTDWQ